MICGSGSLRCSRRSSHLFNVLHLIDLNRLRDSMVVTLNITRVRYQHRLNWFYCCVWRLIILLISNIGDTIFIIFYRVISLSHRKHCLSVVLMNQKSDAVVAGQSEAEERWNTFWKHDAGAGVPPGFTRILMNANYECQGKPASKNNLYINTDLTGLTLLWITCPVVGTHWHWCDVLKHSTIISC